MKHNIAIDTDAYKLNHWKAMPEGFTKQYAYAEARRGSKYEFTSFFGLQPIIQDNLLTVPSDADIQEAQEYSFETFGEDYFNKEVWKKVQNLGYVPLHIKAAPEGLNIPTSNVLFTYESTKDWFAPAANSLEPLLMQFWYPTVTSTRTKLIKEKLKPLVIKSGSLANLEYMVTDFGTRGATSYESAAIGGSAVMVHFQGSDNMIANRHIGEYYGLKGRAKSVFASEHSISLAFGPGEGEKTYLKHMLNAAPLKAKVACVIDTYDSANFMRNVVSDPEIVASIIKRAEAGGSVIFRPDSGIPIEQCEMCFESLAAIFGYTLNDRYYKVLNHNVRVIQGDGMDEESIIKLYNDIIENKWSSDNLFVGAGSGLLQLNNHRDLIRAAIKPSFGIINDKLVNFQKVPASDMTKASKTGELKLHPGLNNNYRTISSVGESSAQFNGYVDVLRTVYLDGKMVNKSSFEQIIENSNKPLGWLEYTMKHE